MKRPISVTSLTIGVLIFTVDNLARVFETVRQWAQLSELSLMVPPLYLALTGLVWGLAGLVVAMGLWRAKPWSLRGAVVLVLLYAVYDGLERILVMPSPARLASWPFFLGLTLVILILIIWIRSRSPVKSYFGVLHGRKPEDRELT